MPAQSKIVIVCGKGGVGKTTIGLALALRHAAEGRKVLVVTSHPLPELAVAVSLEGLAKRSPMAARNLFVVHLEPRELLAEVVEKNFPIPMVVRAILNSPIYRNLVEVAPGLKEFYLLARLQQLAERAAGGLPDYDLLLWDAPATGHFLATLRAARSFETYLTGPLAAAGAQLVRFFSSASQIALFPATTLEEMAAAETIEMCANLEREFQLKPAALLLNLVSPLVAATGPALEEVRRAAESSGEPALRFALNRGLLERERAAALGETVSARTVAIQRVRWSPTDLDLLEQVGQSLAALPVAA